MPKKEVAPCHNRQSGSKAFTLIELLVTIALVIVLALATILVLNPAQLLKQSRDSTRLSDLEALQKSVLIYQIDNGTVGTANTVYVSLPDATSTPCASLGLPSLASGFVYHCVTPQNLHNVDGTGWIPLNFSALLAGAPISELPIDPINASSSGNWYSFSVVTSGWVLSAHILESTKYATRASLDGGTSATAYETGSNLAINIVPPACDANYILVPGNATFGTTDFCVMKYEAKCLSGGVPLLSPVTGVGVFNDNTATPCTAANGFTVGSAPTGYPIGGISHDNAKLRCASINGAHLLTNDEYMTITRNAEQVASNWSSSTVGNGLFYIGNDNAGSGGLEASADDTNGLYGETIPLSYTVRTWRLSNSNVIWDLAGNVNEHVQRSTNNSGDTLTTIVAPTCSAAGTTCEYASGTSLPYITTYNDASFSAATVGPSNLAWNRSKGMGTVNISSPGNIFYRGGNSSLGGNPPNGGAYYLVLGAGFTNTGIPAGVGFRCVKAPN